MIGFGENLGSGFPLILSAWNEKHWLNPELLEQPELMQVKLSLTVADVVKDVTKDFAKEITERQLVILEMMATEPTLSAKTISEKNSGKGSEKESITERTIQNDLARLKKLGILTREGGRKKGHWVINVKE